MDRKKERVCVGQTSQLAVGPSESGPCGERREREGKRKERKEMRKREKEKGKGEKKWRKEKRKWEKEKGREKGGGECAPAATAAAVGHARRRSRVRGPGEVGHARRLRPSGARVHAAGKREERFAATVATSGEEKGRRVRSAFEIG